LTVLANIDNYVALLENIYWFMIIAYVFLSWVPNVRQSFVGDLLAKLVEPYLTPFRKLIPPIGGMLDISPVVALIALRYVSLGIAEVLKFIVKPFI
jgi:YggT family protein